MHYDVDEVQAKYDQAFELLGSKAEGLLIVPPFSDLYSPNLGVHLLQAAAEKAGFRVPILYANLLFALVSGEETYNAICKANYRWMWGERIFTATAFGLPPLGYQTEKLREEVSDAANKRGVTYEDLAALEREAGPFCFEFGRRLAALPFRVAGASTTFQQTAASIGLLAAIKRARPDVTTILGGSNCEGEMARGIASLAAPIDYIFSGECDSAFPDFLRRVVSGEPLPTDRIVRGAACFDMDSLPEPNYDDYFAQREITLPKLPNMNAWLPYESSRGCWWGALQHCTFCGLSDETMAFRHKSPDVMINGTKRLLAKYPSRLISMIDSILPHSYFRTVLPRIAEELPPVRIFYEAKANLNLQQVQILRRAGVDRIQPGIEALSSALLRRMKKGVLARQNLALLRYGRAAGLTVTWNMLYNFPGDQREDYDATLALIPLIHHLSPPAGLHPLYLIRFSPYYEEAASFGVTGIEPSSGYACAFPASANLRSLAYHFTGDYASALHSHPELKGALERATGAWREGWQPGSRPPALSLTPGKDGYYTLTDTRTLEGTDMFQFLNEEEARAVLIGGPLDRQPLAAWAIERKLAVALDGWCVPLAVTDVETWHRLEGRAPQAAVQTMVLQDRG
ncbi:MAG: RiPP maturation radical SAM C-methyltransferase [Terriglobia bacterium]|jgi:ribosomal peptide maturation radical SAM protein 1